MPEDSRKDQALSQGPGHQVDKQPPAPSTLAEERDNPGMDEKARGELGAPQSALPTRTADTEVGDRFKQ